MQLCCSLFHRFFNDGRECFRFPDSQVSQHLAIEVDLGFLHAMDQLAVGCPIQTSCRIDAGNPQFAEVPFAVPAVTIGIPLTLEVLLIRPAEQLALGAVLAFVEL